MQHSKIKLSQFHLTDIMILYFLHVAMDISYEKCCFIKAFFLNVSNNFSLLCRPCIDNTKNPLKTNIKVHKTTVFILTIEKNNFCIDAKIGRKHNWVQTVELE